MAKNQAKPRYWVPYLSTIRELPWNGYKVASFFAGGGGSSTGYRMAGFRVVYANEFIEAARETYAANASPETFIDPRDIRTISAQDVLDRAGLERGELDVLDGSPPCASFSTAGQRERGWGKVKQYSDTKQRTDDLFFEFARMVDGLQPKVFVAENVAGLVKGTAKGYFLEILADLRARGYRVRSKLLDAQWLGVPQARARLIFIGVREDLGLEPAFPAPLPYRYTIRDALALDAGVGRRVKNAELVGEDVGASLEGYAVGDEWDRVAPGDSSERFFSLVRPDPDAPCPTITANGGGGDHAAPGSVASVTHPTQKRKFTVAELKALGGFPPDYQLTGSYAQQWERVGRAVPPLMMRAIAATVRDSILGRVSQAARSA